MNMKRKIDLSTARASLAAMVLVSVVLVTYVGAPVGPVTIGSAMAYMWLLWRAAGQR